MDGLFFLTVLFDGLLRSDHVRSVTWQLINFSKTLIGHNRHIVNKSPITKLLSSFLFPGL